MKIKLRKISLADAPIWLELQVEAFTPLLEKYQDYEMNPAAETLEQVREQISLPFLEHFFIDKDATIVGGVWTERISKARYRLGGIFVLPRDQGLGIGQVAMNLVEARYPNASSWELDTPLQEKRNCHFYEKLGYRRKRRKEVVNDRLTLVYYKKYV